VRLRSDLILRTVASFRPDLILIDKKPYGVEHELRAALDYVQTHLPETRLILLLRDILDGVKTTTDVWRKNGYYEAIRQFYDLVLVVGVPGIFDPRKEYCFPPSVAKKVRFCGYIKNEANGQRREALRKELQLGTQKLVLVTVGGGEDGYHLLEIYLRGLAELSAAQRFDSLLVCGPEMLPSQRTRLCQAAARYPHVQVREFVDDLPSYMDAADMVVSMAGYNTLSELLSLQKRAIVVPRIKPVAEQWIRTQRMASLGLFQVMHPDTLTPAKLIGTVSEMLHSANGTCVSQPQLDLGALPRITQYIATRLGETRLANSATTIFQERCLA
jgi:predicted glycosyltransferase